MVPARRRADVEAGPSLADRNPDTRPATAVELEQLEDAAANRTAARRRGPGTRSEVPDVLVSLLRPDPVDVRRPGVVRVGRKRTPHTARRTVARGLRRRCRLATWNALRRTQRTRGCCGSALRAERRAKAHGPAMAGLHQLVTPSRFRPPAPAWRGGFAAAPAPHGGGQLGSARRPAAVVALAAALLEHQRRAALGADDLVVQGRIVAVPDLSQHLG